MDLDDQAAHDDGDADIPGLPDAADEGHGDGEGSDRDGEANPKEDAALTPAAARAEVAKLRSAVSSTMRYCAVTLVKSLSKRKFAVFCNLHQPVEAAFWEERHAFTTRHGVRSLHVALSLGAYWKTLLELWRHFHSQDFAHKCGFASEKALGEVARQDGKLATVAADFLVESLAELGLTNLSYTSQFPMKFFGLLGAPQERRPCSPARSHPPPCPSGHGPASSPTRRPPPPHPTPHLRREPSSRVSWRIAQRHHSWGYKHHRYHGPTGTTACWHTHTMAAGSRREPFGAWGFNKKNIRPQPPVTGSAPNGISAQNFFSEVGIRRMYRKTATDPRLSLM